MNNPSLVSYYVFVFKYYVFDHFSCDFLLTPIVFHQEKYLMCHHSTLFNPKLYFGIPIDHQGLIIMEISQKIKKSR